MITAHLPSGYVLAHALPKDRRVFWSVILGAVMPDLDLIWFYGIDGRAFHHHRYWPHIPFVWAMVAVVALPLISLFLRRWLAPAAAFLAAVFLHICLDSIAGDILWGWPWTDRLYHLIAVQDRFSHWIVNFILHPVFLLEIGIWSAAFVLWSRAKGQRA